MNADPQGADFDPTRYWNQRFLDRYTLSSTGWLGLGESYNRWMYVVRRRAFTDVVHAVIDKHRLPALRTLDVGSGTGVFLDAWRRQGVRNLTGSDLTPTAVERLRSSFPSLEIHQLDIGSPVVPLPEQSFDLVSIMDVLYHIVDDGRYAQAISNLAWLLKPGGLLIMSENLGDRELRGLHAVTRSREHILGLLSDAGLDRLLSRPMFFLMDAPADPNRRLLQTWWRLLASVVRRNEVLGWSIGAALAPMELVLASMSVRGPSTEILACRRRT